MKELLISKNRILLIPKMGFALLIIFLTLYVCHNMYQLSADPYSGQGINGASFAWGSSTSQELIEQADIIGLGKVIDHYTILVYDLVATSNIIEFKNVYMISNELVKNDIFGSSITKNSPLRIELWQTGGVYGEYKTRPIMDAPLLEVDKTYLLFLKHLSDVNQDVNHYVILGGYQGVADIVKGNVSFASKEINYDFSDLNVSLTDFTDRLQQFDLAQNKHFINSENLPTEVFVLDLLENYNI